MNTTALFMNCNVDSHSFSDCLLSLMLKRSEMGRPQFTPQQRAFLVREYHWSNNNVVRVLERFWKQYLNVRCPSRRTVYKNVNKYNVSGTSCNLNKGRSGQWKTARTEENIQAIQNALDQRPVGQRISARCQTTIWKVAKCQTTIWKVARGGKYLSYTPT